MDLWYNTNMKKKKVIILSSLIILFALVLEAGILTYANERNAYRTSTVLLDRVIAVLNKNDETRDKLIQSLKEDYIVRAKSVSYILDAKPQVEYDIDELLTIADLMSIDEIHLFDESGCIYSGTMPQYFGYSFDSGEQMAYFKPMLSDKELTMCQDVVPNTAEAKNMMYAITWNEDKTKMVQVGIKPKRLLDEMRQNNVSSLVDDMPVYEGMKIFVARTTDKTISGATDNSTIGKTLEEIGISTKDIHKNESKITDLFINGEPYRCVMRQDENYIAIVAMEHTFYRQETIYAILIVAIYLILASLCIIYMIFRVMREKFEKEKLFYTSTTDAITKCLNRRAYEEDIARLDPLEEWIYISLDLNGLKHENDTYGHVAGDELICAAAGFMESSFHEYGKIYRIGGDEFVVIVTKHIHQFKEMLKEFDDSVANWHGELVKSMTISYGYVYSTEQEWETVYDIAKAADDRMYQSKEIFYTKNGSGKRKVR